MRNWNAKVIRGFAILNVGLCLFGLWAMLFAFVITAFSLRTQYDPGQPYLLQMFYLFNALDFICLVIGLVSAVPLWRLGGSGLLLCNLLFGFELLYWTVDMALAINFIDSSNQVLRG